MGMLDDWEQLTTTCQIRVRKIIHVDMDAFYASVNTRQSGTARQASGHRRV